MCVYIYIYIYMIIISITLSLVLSSLLLLSVCERGRRLPAWRADAKTASLGWREGAIIVYVDYYIL